MPVYNTSEQLYQCLKLLFTRLDEVYPSASQKVASSHLVMRMRLREPSAEVLIDGRSNPVKIGFGPSTIRPDLELNLTADALHNILLGKLNLKKAIGSGSLSFRGPVWKSFVMEDIFRRGQILYPDILRECNV